MAGGGGGERGDKATPELLGSELLAGRIGELLVLLILEATLKTSPSPELCCAFTPALLCVARLLCVALLCVALLCVALLCS